MNGFLKRNMMTNEDPMLSNGFVRRDPLLSNSTWSIINIPHDNVLRQALLGDKEDDKEDSSDPLIKTPLFASTEDLEVKEGPLRGNPLLGGSEFTPPRSKGKRAAIDDDALTLDDSLFSETPLTPIHELHFPKSPKICLQENFRIIEIDGVLPEAQTILTTDNTGSLVSDGSEYTTLLSQLSGTLPTISSSQVSSVLSALEPSTPPPSQLLTAVASILPKETETQKEESKIAKPTLPAPVEMKLNKYLWWKCPMCPFLSLYRHSVSTHISKAHPTGRIDRVHKLLEENKLTCMGCPNTFYNAQSLRVHLQMDHEVAHNEVQDLVDSTVKVNMARRKEEKEKAKKLPDKPVKVVESVDSLSPSLPSLTSAEFVLFDSVEKILDEVENGGRVIEKDNLVGPTVAPPPPPPPQNTVSMETVEVPLGDDVSGLFVLDNVEIKQNSKVEKVIFLKSGKEGTKCPLDGCTVRLVSPDNLLYHERCHRGSYWKCPECEDSSNTWYKLTLHLWKMHGIDMELYACDQCEFKTNSLSQLINTHKRLHSDEKPFLCDLCSKGFKTYKQMYNHKVRHTSKTSCRMCNRMLSGKELKNHINMVHRKLRPFVCSMCGHAAPIKSALKAHLRMHTGEKPYSCTECEYTTADHNSLRRHKMQHSGAKCYACPHCDYTCIQSITYKEHLKSKHPGLDEGLMFSCKMCPFRSVKKENFVTHMATTHGTEPPNLPV